MSVQLNLVRSDGSIRPYVLENRSPVEPRQRKIVSRVAYAAAHVVSDPLADVDPTLQAALDWESTLAYRRYLWSLGLGVAEAMDTAQRGAGLNWETTKELISRSVAEARSVNGNVACGAGTDHLEVAPTTSIHDVEAAYEEQVGFVESQGGKVILMASRALAACAKSGDDYARVYDRILSQVSRPVIIHWLGDMFDPALEGYWGSDDLDAATDVCLDIITRHAEKVEGIKISLLDADREVSMRRCLPKGVRMFTGDDYNFADLIRGDERGHSDALLGIFDSIAPIASEALAALDGEDVGAYEQLLAPTVPLSRHIFAPPTRFYKTGVVFLAYLNGHQSHFHMVGGQQSARSVLHLSRLFELADSAGLLSDPEMAVERMRRVLRVAGVD